MRVAESAIEREPARRLVLLFREEGIDAAPKFLSLLQRKPAAVVCRDSEERVVALIERHVPDARVVLAFHNRKRRLSADILRTAIAIGNDRRIIWPASVMSAIEMIKRGHGDGQTLSRGVQPGERNEIVILAFGIPNSTRLLLRSVRHLKEIVAI